ncbi:MAG TPA: adenylate/guanylate cyclase domain-containing protein [Geminicoccaceae bacterium]|nr:adenylate/guanylate cyclase domain-containing protein [Geminicoccaceae bacterium]
MAPRPGEHAEHAWSRPSTRQRAEVLPQRVRRTIVARQIESERLIGWIQLAVVIGFAALFAVAPKSAPRGALIDPVPIALAVYLLFTLLRLALAYYVDLPRWFLGLSAVVDVTLLMLLIWSFHIQYTQPAAFYLKAPTWGYVFIFIAVRALRFEPRYVLVAGIAAMIGWAALVAYAVLSDPGMPITRDYVRYMNSTTILLVAEFDKLLSIALVTAILALALHRGRQLLIESAIEAQAARDLARFFTPEIARQITSAERPLEPGEGQLREAAVLQVDVKGFSRLISTLTPDQALGLLTEYQAQVMPIIRHHGGCVDKFMGDGIMATFGAAGPSTTFAADALRTALELAEMARAWPPGAEPLAISIAVVSGELVVGAVGDADRLEHTVIGHPVNLAAKLEKHTRSEGVSALTTAATLALARRQGLRGDFAPPLTRTVAGVAHPVELIVLAP